MNEQIQNILRENETKTSKIQKLLEAVIEKFYSMLRQPY